MKYILCIAAAVFLFSCNYNQIKKEIQNSPNILLIIADDMGKDALAGFTEGIIKPHTPNIDAIRNTVTKIYQQQYQ